MGRRPRAALDLTPVPGLRSVTTIRERDVPVAAMVHDAALDEHPDFVRAAGNYAAMALNNHELVAQVTSSLREVQDSRARIVASADAERRRIERDLHDGAQQRLVALRIKLGLAEEALSEDPGRSREPAAGDRRETVQALEDVRSLAHGVYPALLMQRGLRDALREAALRSPIPVRVDAGGIGRYPPEVESAVYFCCLEAMQNAIKHGDGASLIAIALSDDGRLRFEVADNGRGFDAASTPSGAGRANIRDRLAAVGGCLTYRSQVGKGTQVVGVVPPSRRRRPRAAADLTRARPGAHMHPQRHGQGRRRIGRRLARPGGSALTAVSAPLIVVMAAAADRPLPTVARACTTAIRVGAPWQRRRALGENSYGEP